MITYRGIGDHVHWIAHCYKEKCWNTNATFSDGKLEWIGMRFEFRREGDEVKGKRYSYNQGITHSITLKR